MTTGVRKIVFEQRNRRYVLSGYGMMARLGPLWAESRQSGPVVSEVVFVDLTLNWCLITVKYTCVLSS